MPADPVSPNAHYRSAIYAVNRRGVPYAFTFRVSAGRLATPVELPFPQPWAIITASNPGSTPLPDAENLRRQDDLVRDIQAAGFTHHPAEGQSPAGTPPWREPSLLVERIGRKAALDLARRYGQRAIVFAHHRHVGVLMVDTDQFESLRPLAPSPP
jgi:hypothetical protein